MTSFHVLSLLVGRSVVITKITMTTVYLHFFLLRGNQPHEHTCVQCGGGALTQMDRTMASDNDIGRLVLGLHFGNASTDRD